MEKTEPTLWSALSEFQQECPVIEKSTQAFKYKYANLASIMQTIHPLLKRHGLVLAQPINGRIIKTILTHIPTGEQLISETEIPVADQNLAGMNQYQTDGSAISYYRRYSLSMLCLITDKDTDAGGASSNQPTDKRRRVKVGTSLFKNAVKGVEDGNDRDELSKHFIVDDETWQEILKAAQS